MLYGIIGSGGFGRECIWLAEEACAIEHGTSRPYSLCFVEHEPRHATVNGYSVMRFDEFIALGDTARRFNVAIADPATRRRIAGECEASGLKAFSIRSRLAEVHPTAVIEEGAVLCQFTLVSANARVGRHFHLNHHGYVSHDCTVGDFVTFAPGVRCNGTISIGDAAYVGSGAIIRQGTSKRDVTIGARAVIGMGAVVLNSVPDDCTVIGNPARPLTPRDRR